MDYLKTRISPSDLTFKWGECQRCFWLKYREGIIYEGIFPGIVTALSSRQERWYKRRHSHDFSATLPVGRSIDSGKMLESAPIVVNGEVTPFTLGGKYDFLLQYDDGSYGIIDTKLVANGGKAKFYWPQLGAYAYILANPKDGEPRHCTTLGLVVWTAADASHLDGSQFTVGFIADYEPVDLNPAGFELLIAEIVTCLMGDIPEENSECAQCKFLQKMRGRS